MSEKAFAKFKIISIAVFMLGLFSVALAFSVHKPNGKNLRHRKGFTLIKKETAILSSGGQQLLPEISEVTTIKYHKSDGSWKSVRISRNPDGSFRRKEITVGVPGQGVFKVNLKQSTLDFLSSMPSKEITSYVPHTDWYTDPHYLKDDWVQGYQTHVLRFPDPEGGYVEMYFAPELDDEIVRRVDVTPYGTAIEELFEVKLGEPAENAVGPLPQWLVHYDQFKAKIATMEERGHQKAAEAMRRELVEQLAKDPDG